MSDKKEWHETTTVWGQCAPAYEDGYRSGYTDALSSLKKRVKNESDDLGDVLWWIDELAAGRHR